jgi:hypothetical protein
VVVDAQRSNLLQLSDGRRIAQQWAPNLIQYQPRCPSCVLSITSGCSLTCLFDDGELVVERRECQYPWTAKQKWVKDSSLAGLGPGPPKSRKIRVFPEACQSRAHVITSIRNALQVARLVLHCLVRPSSRAVLVVTKRCTSWSLVRSTRLENVKYSLHLEVAGTPHSQFLTQLSLCKAS